LMAGGKVRSRHKTESEGAVQCSAARGAEQLRSLVGQTTTALLQKVARVGVWALCNL
jgi:hypothetical protein